MQAAVTELHQAERGTVTAPGKRSTFIATVLLAAAALTTPAPAFADKTDDIYLAYLPALKAGGISIPNRDAAIAMGHTVCVAWGQGPNAKRCGAGPYDRLSPTEAGHVLGVSVAAYCPQYRDDLKQSGG